MDIKKLNEKQKKESRDIYKYYKFVNICSKCKMMYGSDRKERVEICTTCYFKLHGKKTI